MGSDLFGGYDEPPAQQQQQQQQNFRTGKRQIARPGEGSRGDGLDGSGDGWGVSLLSVCEPGDD
jgi:hypothetical protein